jgi:LPXTG-motif cell wall-anchored protein
MAVAMLEGEFAFEGIEPGSYSVKATLDGYDPAVEHAVVANDATTVVNAVLAGVVAIVEPPIPPAEPPELPKTGAGIFGFVALGLAAATVGYGLRRR